MLVYDKHCNAHGLDRSKLHTRTHTQFAHACVVSEINHVSGWSSHGLLPHVINRGALYFKWTIYTAQMWCAIFEPHNDQYEQSEIHHPWLGRSSGAGVRGSVDALSDIFSRCLSTVDRPLGEGIRNHEGGHNDT